MSKFDNTIYKGWAEHEPFGPWADCIICAGDINYKEPCTWVHPEGNNEGCWTCQLGYQPCQDPIDPGCLVPNNN